LAFVAALKIIAKLIICPLVGRYKLEEIMRKILPLTVLFLSAVANAGGWTTYGEDSGSVEFVEVVRAQGFLVKGKFGDPAECGTLDHLWVGADHPQYDQLYSTALAAFMSGKKIQAYAHTCTEIGWHGGSYNTLTGAGSMYIKN
jgi:hypothetical protein